MGQPGEIHDHYNVGSQGLFKPALLPLGVSFCLKVLLVPEVVQRIIRADPEQRVWDSLRSFLEIGHQLLTNIEAMNKARRDAIQMEEGCRAEATRLKEKGTEVANLQEALEKE
ncbi:uncharacterized protein [Elaeis guineensis]|uniref:uncharacterized protein n=1 Tax=Elaeis guineensis var. tenera TaxID=51953 RepID=UPI003C6D0E70